jgi:hypothetical protein
LVTAAEPSATSPPPTPAPALAPSDPWLAVRRVEEWAGEVRVNRIRIIAIVVFYARHLIDMYMRHDVGFGGLTYAARRYHAQATAVVIAWSVFAIVLHLLLSRRRVMPAMKFVAVAFDLLMITLLGIIAGGPRSPLLLLYFVIIASAALRLSLPLAWTATLGAWAGYAAVMMYYAWVLIGWDKYYATPELRIPRGEQAIFILSLGAAGLMAGQVVRQVRRIAHGHSVAIDHTGEGE